MDELLRPEDVAEHYKVSVATVRRWCRERQLTATKAGKQWRIKPSDLEAFFKAMEVQEPKKVDGLAFAH